MLVPESFTISVEFVAICMEFNVTWELNGSQIIDDYNHLIVNSGLNQSRYKTSIEIFQSSSQEAGTYTVIITSTTGSDNANITIEIIG